MRRALGATALALALALAGAPPASAQAIHALVVGIDVYSRHGQLKDLKGAVNDARDIEAALRELGATRIVRLLDDEARRDAILGAWAELRAAAKSGDTLIFTYSGHGGQEPERIRGSEADGKDEVMLLGRFRTTRPFNYERIVDDEWRARIDDARDLNVVMLFDSCHSGSATRSSVNEEESVRFAGNYGAIEDDAVPLAPARPESAPGASDHELYIGAGADAQRVPELRIDGAMRGALSYHFARALRGAADVDRDGVLTRGELAAYLRNNVAITSGNLQRPTIEFSGAADRPVFRVAASPPVRIEAPAIELALRDAAPEQEAAARQLLRDVRLVPDRGGATLTWRPATGEVFTANDLVAERIDGAARLQGVIDRWRALAVARQLAERRSLAVRIREGDRRHVPGERVCMEIEASVADTLRLVVFNLAGDGTVQFLGTEADARGAAPGCPRGALGPFPVTSPFGADHVVVVAAPAPEAQPLVPLVEALRRLDGRIEAQRVIALLAGLARDAPPPRVGIVGLYTAARR